MDVFPFSNDEGSVGDRGKETFKTVNMDLNMDYRLDFCLLTAKMVIEIFDQLLDVKQKVDEEKSM